MGELKIFAGNSNPPLADEICQYVDVPLGKAVVKKFSDGETMVEIHESVRDADIFLVQSTCPPSNSNLMELLVMIDALNRASAERITAVIPYYGYARQDRKLAPRAPITAKLVANLLTAADADRVLCLELHAGQIAGFFDIPVDNLYATPVILEHIRENWLNDLVIVSPDAGGVERARAFAKRLDAGLAIIDKRRPGPNESEVMHVIGDIDGTTAIILDDIVDTAGTLAKAAEALKAHGAAHVIGCCTHPVLSGEAVARIDGSPLEKLVVTNTIPFEGTVKDCRKIEALSVAPLLGEAIKRIHSGDSVSSLFV